MCVLVPSGHAWMTEKGICEVIITRRQKRCRMAGVLWKNAPGGVNAKCARDLYIPFPLVHGPKMQGSRSEHRLVHTAPAMKLGRMAPQTLVTAAGIPIPSNER